MSVASSKAKLAGLVAHRDPDDPAITEARRSLRAAVAENYLTRLRDQEDLSAEQRTRLAVLLLAPANGDEG